jgi:hypothetical protein
MHLESKRIRISSGRKAIITETVVCGPLCVNARDGQVTSGWVVTHRASGQFIASPFTTPTAALLFCGALLTMGIDWSLPTPAVTPDQATLIRAAADDIQRALVAPEVPA